MKHTHTLISFPLLTDRPLVFYSILSIAAVIVIFTLLVIRHSFVRRKVRQAAAASITQTPASEPHNAHQSTKPFPALIALVSPISGKVGALSQVENEALVSAIIKEGCAIEPTEGKVYAPCDCTVSALSECFHALGLICSSAEVCIRIGSGDHASANDFIPCCKAGDKVKEGDLLLSFDFDALDKVGYDMTALITVENADRFAEITLTKERKVSVGDNLLTLIPKTQNSSPL